MREVDGLVFTEEEVNLDRLEKHIFVWKLDLEGGGGRGAQIENMLAERLMRESALLMRTLQSYAVPDGVEAASKAEALSRGSLGVAARPYRPQPLVKERVEPERRREEKGLDRRRNGAAWAGGVVDEGNAVTRVKRNIFGDIMHQLFGVATDEQLQQQLRVDEEMRSKVADTLTRQVYYE